MAIQMSWFASERPLIKVSYPQKFYEVDRASDVLFS